MSFNINKGIQAQRFARPQFTYLWRVQLPDLSVDNVISGLTLPNEFSISALTDFSGPSQTMDLELLSSRVSNISTPFIEIETDKSPEGNSFWYYARHNDIGTISMEIDEHEDGLTLDYLRKWIRLISPSEHGTYNPPALYKRDIKYYTLSSVKGDIDIQEFIYKGYFLNNIAEVASDYESNAIRRYNVTFTGDSVVVNNRYSEFLEAISQRERAILEQELEQTSFFEEFTMPDLSNARRIFERVINRGLF